MNDEYDHLRESARFDTIEGITPPDPRERDDSLCGRLNCGHSFDDHSINNPGCGCGIDNCEGRLTDRIMPENAYDGDYSEVSDLLRKVGITLDNSDEDRQRFAALRELLAVYFHYRQADITKPLDVEDAEEFLVG